MPLVNCKVELFLRCIDKCILKTAAIGANANDTGADGATCEITDAKIYVPVVILSTEDSTKLAKQLREGFKKPFDWDKNEITDKKTYNSGATIKELLDYSDQEVKRLFVLAYNNPDGDANRVDADSFKKYFLPRVKIVNCNIEINGKIFYDQPINDWIKQYGEVRKVLTGQGDEYTAGFLLDFAYFEKTIAY